MQGEVMLSRRNFLYRSNTPANFPKNKYETPQQRLGFEADPAIVEIWENYRRVTGYHPPFELVMALVKRLAENIGEDFENWLWQNAKNNSQLGDYGIEFLKDCILYTQTGMREKSLDVWLTLIETESSDERPLNDLNDRTTLFADTPLPKLSTLIKDWLSRDGGLSDLFFTAHILFGNK